MEQHHQREQTVVESGERHVSVVRGAKGEPVVIGALLLDALPARMSAFAHELPGRAHLADNVVDGPVRVCFYGLRHRPKAKRISLGLRSSRSPIPLGCLIRANDYIEELDMAH